MKKLLSILVAMLLFVALPSCDKSDDPTPSDPVEDTTSTDPGTNPVTVSTDITFVLTYEGSWNGSYWQIPALFFGTDSTDVANEAASTDYTEYGDVINFGLVHKPSSSMDPCTYVNSNEYKNHGDTKRVKTITVEEGEKVYIAVSNRINSSGARDVTHSGYITIDNSGITNLHTYGLSPNAVSHGSSAAIQDITVESGCTNVVAISY